VEKGEVVAASTTAFALIATDVLEARVAVPARELPRLDLDRPAGLSFPDRPGLRGLGRIDHPPVSSDVRSGTVPLVVAIDNPDGQLLPGMLVEVELQLQQHANPTEVELCIPLTAVRVRDEGPLVYVVEDGLSRAVPVSLGEVRGDEVVVSSGLEPGDVLVDRAPDRLRDGDRVVSAQ
jgi:RND family efflux transporter MFP subunit